MVPNATRFAGDLLSCRLRKPVGLCGSFLGASRDLHDRLTDRSPRARGLHHRASRLEPDSVGLKVAPFDRYSARSNPEPPTVRPKLPSRRLKLAAIDPEAPFVAS